MSFHTVDLTNMVRGEGEWKNMQEIVRRTLKICFDQMERQGEQVAVLTGQVASLKSQLATKANRDELGPLQQTSNKNANAAVPPSRDLVTKADLDKLKERVIHLQNDLERKASIRYTDECLQRKVDRSDMLVKNLATFSAAQYSSQLTQLYKDVTDTKAAVDSISRATADMQRDLAGAQDLHVMRNQMEAIYRSMEDYYTKNHLQALLNQKQDVSGLDAILQNKVDRSALNAMTSRVEGALEAHEKAITALRLKLNDGSLFEARETLARNSAAAPLFCQSSDGPCRARRCVRRRKSRKAPSKIGSHAGESDNASSGYDSSASTGSCSCHVEGPGSQGQGGTARNTAHNSRTAAVTGRRQEHDMQSVLRDGRVQALIEGLWTKVDNAEVSAQRLRQEQEGMRGALSRVEATLSQVAGAAQMETLGLVVEEQRRRIDSILTGSLAIECITEEFVRQQGDIAEVQSFLSLPQHRPLKEQLHEAGELISVLSDRVAEQSVALGRAGLRIEAVETINRQLETRVQMAEGYRERVMHLQNVLDLSGTEYSSIKDVARRLSGVCAVILGQDGATDTAMAAISRKHAPVVTRVQTLETSSAQAEQQRAQLEARLRELKQIVGTIGFSQSSQVSGALSGGSRGGYGGSDAFSLGGGSAGGNSGVGGWGSASTGSPRYASSSPSPTSPARRGAAQGSSRVQPGLVVGGPMSPATPLRSPSSSPSPVRSLGRDVRGSPTQRHVNFASSLRDEPDAAVGLDDSRVSVDFEQALEQMLDSINADPDLHVPVQRGPPSRPSGASGFALGGSSGAFTGTGFSSGAGSGAAVSGRGVTSTTRTASLQRVDDRLNELKAEKERLRRLLMSRVETL